MERVFSTDLDYYEILRSGKVTSLIEVYDFELDAPILMGIINTPSF